jgi:hypothetical protein
LLGESVQSKHALRPHGFDITQEIIVIGMIREGKRRVNLKAMNRAGVDRPASKRRGAGSSHQLQYS